jgi:hypothetical protein
MTILYTGNEVRDMAERLERLQRHNDYLANQVQHMRGLLKEHVLTEEDKVRLGVGDRDMMFDTPSAYPRQVRVRR